MRFSDVNVGLQTDENTKFNEFVISTINRS